jgi:hypothetical protein
MRYRNNVKLLTGSNGTYAVSAVAGITTSNTVATLTMSTWAGGDEGVVMRSPANDPDNRLGAALVVARSTRQNHPLVVTTT